MHPRLRHVPPNAPSSTSGESFPGLGLGLHISADIVKRHGGKIWVESTKGKGTIFYFTLPVEKKKN